MKEYSFVSDILKNRFQHYYFMLIVALLLLNFLSLYMS